MIEIVEFNYLPSNQSSRMHGKLIYLLLYSRSQQHEDTAQTLARPVARKQAGLYSVPLSTLHPPRRTLSFVSARNANTETHNIRNDGQFSQRRSPKQQSSCCAIINEVFSTILFFFFLRCYNLFARYIFSSILTD